LVGNAAESELGEAGREDRAEIDFVVEGERGSPFGVKASPLGRLREREREALREEEEESPARELDLDRLPITGRAEGFGSAAARLARCWLERGSAEVAEKNSPFVEGSPECPRL